jgi:hypothetical protein
MANLTGIKGPSQKPFRDALRMELLAAGEDHKSLRRVARALIAQAETGDVSAINAIADRLDGKVAQPVGGSDELGPTRLQISWKPNDTNDMRVVEHAPLELPAAIVQTVAANHIDQVIDVIDQSASSAALATKADDVDAPP